MPELPDVEIRRRRLAAEALHRRVESAHVLDPRALRGSSPHAFVQAVVGRTFADTGRHGKWLFAEIEGGPWVVLHFGMTGDVAVTGPEERPKHARVSFRFSDGGLLHFVDQRRLGRVGLTPEPGILIEERRLGPDALDPKLTAGSFARRLEERHGPLKGVLLDQSFIAGIGNIYGDEICHAARIAPMSRTERTAPALHRSLFRAMRSVLSTAIDRQAGGRGFPKGWLIAQRHSGGTCDDCGGPVARQRFQGRYTYWCPSCQPTL